MDTYHLTDNERAIVRFALRRVYVDPDGNPFPRDGDTFKPADSVRELHDRFFATEVISVDKQDYLDVLERLGG